MVSSQQQLWLLFFIFKLIYSADDDIVEIIQNEDYSVEKYFITTEDKYILGLYRIPSKQPNGKSVFLMHGLLNSAIDFIIFGRKYSLGFILATAGYDVWLGNARGTTYSRQHKSLDPNNSAAFWNFSFHEIGKYDLPAMIDFALIKSNHTSLHYIGHSQGGTVVYVMLSILPKYNEKITSIHAMAPAVFLPNSKVVDRWFINFADELELHTWQQLLTKSFNIYEISIHRPEIKTFVRMFKQVCSEKSALQLLCMDAMFSAFDTVPPSMNKLTSTYFSRNTPNSISSKQLVHFSQFIKSGRFQLFDYKSALNYQLYRQVIPPLYNLSNARVDMQILYGTKDYITPDVDVEKLIKVCSNHVVSIVKIPGANHVDFIYAKNAYSQYYKKIIEMINKY